MFLVHEEYRSQSKHLKTQVNSGWSSAQAWSGSPRQLRVKAEVPSMAKMALYTLAPSKLSSFSTPLHPRNAGPTSPNIYLATSPISSYPALLSTYPDLLCLFL